MNIDFQKYRGIHPGEILERELSKRSLKQRPFALSINEHPQTFNAIIKGKRGINTSLAIKIEEELNIKEGSFLMLQAFYDIKQEKKKRNKPTPNLSVLRKSLFWDTDFEKIDWLNQHRAVIQRIFERGNDAEKKEITHFYGKAKIQKVLNNIRRKPYKLHQNN